MQAFNRERWYRCRLLTYIGQSSMTNRVRGIDVSARYHVDLHRGKGHHGRLRRVAIAPPANDVMLLCRGHSKSTILLRDVTRFCEMPGLCSRRHIDPKRLNVPILLTSVCKGRTWNRFPQRTCVKLVHWKPREPESTSSSDF